LWSAIFNLKTLRTVNTIPAPKDTNSMANDQDFIAAGNSNAGMPIDLKAPEFLVIEGAGYRGLRDENRRRKKA
jgi:hypothetical protein